MLGLWTSLLRGLGWVPRARATEDELRVLSAVLTGDDPRFRKLEAQLKRASEIERESQTPESFRVGPTSTFDDLSFPLEVERLSSEWLPVHDQVSGRILEFRVVVGRHGFLRGLEGRTMDGGAWPTGWRLTEGGLQAPTQELLRLPSAAAQGRFQDRARRLLSAWVGSDVPAQARLLPPVTEPRVAAKERELGGQLPTAYRQFLGITDGIDLGSARVNGVDDVYVVDNVRLPLFALSWDADDDDDSVIVMRLDGADESVRRIRVHDNEAIPSVVAGNLQEYLRMRFLMPL